MRRMRLSLIAILVLAVVVSVLAGCGRKGLININGEKIAKQEFYDRLEMVPVQTVKGGKQVTVPAGQYVIEQIITEQLLQQLAKDKKAQATPEQVDAKLAYLKKSTGGNFVAQLRQSGMTTEQWKKQMMLQQSVVNLITKGSKVTDAEVKKAYDQAIAQSPSQYVRPETVQISAIIVKDRAKIDKAYKLLKDGQEFSSVAMQLSEERGSAANGGAIGPVAMGMQIVPLPIRQAAFATPVGKYSQPMLVKDKSGAAWVIVMANGKRKASTDSFDDVKAIIREQLAVSKADRKLFDESLRKFIADSTITVNAERYKKIPEMMKKNASVPTDLEPGKMPAATPAK